MSASSICNESKCHNGIHESDIKHSIIIESMTEDVNRFGVVPNIDGFESLESLMRIKGAEDKDVAIQQLDEMSPNSKLMKGKK